MTALRFYSMGLFSCVFWVIILMIAFFNTNPGGWHEFWFFTLILTAFAAVYMSVTLIVLLIRKQMGYPDTYIGTDIKE